MKKLLIAVLMSGAAFAFADTSMNGTNMTMTSMDSKWICTTNASSSDVASDKAADDKMATTAGSASDSFAFAAQNCRDCTKITCEVQQ